MASNAEKGESLIKFLKSKAALDAWMGMICAIMSLGISESEKLFLHVIGGRFRQTFRDFPNKTGHSNPESGEGLRPGFCVLISGSEDVCVIVCPAPQIYVHYPTDDKKKLAELLRFKAVAIPALSIIVGHGYLQIRGSGCVALSLLYQAYLILSRSNLKTR